MTFGEKLKRLRKEKGYSQEELAGLLEVSRQAVSIVNDITNFCFRLLQEPYTAAPAMPKTKFLMSLTINGKVTWGYQRSIKDPAASNGVSNLQRCRAAGYLTLAAVAKCLQAATWLVARGNKLLQISNMFGVTLDYLLKSEGPDENNKENGYYVSRETIDGFFVSGK